MSSHSFFSVSLVFAFFLASCQAPAPAATALPAETTQPPAATAPPATATEMPASALPASADPSRTPTWVWVEPTQPATPTPLPAFQPRAQSANTLRAQADIRGILIGAAVNNGLVHEADYAEVLAREFNLITTENAMKFGIVHPEPGRYDFQAADEIVNFAHGHDIQVRGHTLVWQKQMPEWLQYGDWTPEQVREILHRHIETVVGRYRGKVEIWDVVNEAMTGNGDVQRNFWYKQLGPEYIDLAFQWAHEADPDALLFINDYAAEGINKKSDGLYELVEDMLARGLPVHGVGMQFHLDSGGAQNLDSVTRNMQRLADLGLQIHITELDVALNDDPTPEDLQEQADTYQKILQTCLALPQCTAFITWGFTDKYSWIPETKDGYGSALLFDATYQPKPAYFALLETLQTK
ncbi:MAG: endo-1,4-beta-xylanase [Chloroflexota bacterium]